jgi:ATP-dependent DNA helicase DinG
MSDSKSLFEEEGAIARALYGYETRVQQLEMIDAVEESISKGRNLIVEAGTGSGKSLAYLVPLINWAAAENKRVVVSTFTKALQNQLFVKDLAFLKRTMDTDFRYALCMGSENYACWRKVKKSLPQVAFNNKKHAREAKDILSWLEETETGLATDLDFEPDPSVWNKFSRESELCLGRKCSFREDCFYMKAKRIQSSAHILVANHALLFSDVTSGGRLLPEYHALVLDEAHTVEDVATSHFGRNVTDMRVRRLIDNITGAISGPEAGLEASEDVMSRMTCLRHYLEGLDASAKDFFNSSEILFGEKERTVLFEERDLGARDLVDIIGNIISTIVELCEAIDDQEFSEEIKLYADKFQMLSEDMEFLFEMRREDHVYWAESRTTKSGKRYSFSAAPINVSEQMRLHLFDRICPVILTSATLSSGAGGADFSFLKSRLGLDGFKGMSLDSPFDHSENVLMYIPRGIIDPKEDPEAFNRQISEYMMSIHDCLGGRMFMLFTSYQMLNDVALDVSAKRGDINLLKQGDMPRYVLLDVFKKTRDSVLMGTTTFWQGVDVPGDSLECVIITKLPFAVPSDPVNAARINAVSREGKNAFMEYQLPKAIIMFKQGFGRLIRSRSDRGVVAILDPRVNTRRYGREFLEALPKCRRTDSITDVQEFFQASE